MIRTTLAFMFASTLAVGCSPTTAVVNGKSVARPTLGYTDGYYYAVRHFRAYPEHRGASTGLRSYGGRLAGFACGADFTYESDYSGRVVRLTGFVQPTLPTAGYNRVQEPAHIEVRDTDGRRHIYGSVGDDTALNFIPHDGWSRSIDFTIGADGLHGQVASRAYDLQQVDADTMSGTVRVANDEIVPFELRGLSAVWSMEPADQAAIMPFMLSCSNNEDGRRIEGAYTDTSSPVLYVDFSHRG